MLGFVFRLLFFVSGIVGGFIVGLMFLPLPGKTIFNKMSRLPIGLKNLIDDSVELFGAFFNLSLAIGKDIFNQVLLIQERIEKRINKIKQKENEDLDENDSLRSTDKSVFATQKK